MPFGQRPDTSGSPSIDFDRIYATAIHPALEQAGLEPLHADAVGTDGIIHKARFERLLLCEYAVVDLTGANANVCYQLGVRHALRPSTTVVTFAKDRAAAFDVNYLHGIAYDLGPNNDFTADSARALHEALAQRLMQLGQSATADSVTDSSLFELLTEYRTPDVARLKTDTFRQRVHYAGSIKAALATAREKRDVAALVALEQGLGALECIEAGVLVDLYLSYRALSAWERMVNLHAHLPKAVQTAVLVREQLGFALNRLRRRQEALRVLEEVERQQGPSSETSALIGRVYKDLWVDATNGGDPTLAHEFLGQSIDAYVRGFEADSRDAYPGINAVTLLDVKGTSAAQSKKSELLPVVRFAVLRRVRSGKSDYWDRATLLELAVLDQDVDTANDCLADAHACMRESWEGETTANNLILIREARVAREQIEPWLDAIIRALDPKRLP